VERRAKKIIFLTGTRADYGKLRSLVQILASVEEFDPRIFATGMHMLPEYGSTVHEIFKDGFADTYVFNNVGAEPGMDLSLANTINGFSGYVRATQPDLIVVHGDRPEALAGAIVGVFNNIRVAHIEGGELSGTVDGLIRHSISKLSHAHFVSTVEAKERLVVMGESRNAIFVLGAPSIDLLKSNSLPSLKSVTDHYEIPFDEFSIFSYHPVTTEIDQLERKSADVIAALIASKLNYVVILPNNDLGSKKIIKSFERLAGNDHFRIIASVRFQAYLRLLKECRFIIGNSSSGVCEAPVMGVPTINIGTRQQGRLAGPSVFHCDDNQEAVLATICQILKKERRLQSFTEYGVGDSDQRFLETLNRTAFWDLPIQKEFQDAVDKDSRKIRNKKH